MRGCELRVALKTGAVQRFDGFAADAQADLGQFARQHWGLGLDAVELSVKGHNWGRAEVKADKLAFVVGDRLAFDLALKEATNVVQSAKDEVAVEFTPSEADRRLDSLCEIRFYVPSAPRKDSVDEIDAELNDGADADADGEKENDGADDDRAAALFEAIKGGTDLQQVTGDIFADLPEMPCIVPRGRYGLEMGAEYLRLHGKSYDYKILYSSIAKLFMVPKADDLHVLFVLHLDPAIRQGQTRYPFVVFQFDKDELIEVDLKNIDAATAQSKYEGRLQMRYEAPTFEVVSTLFRVLAGQKILVPGSYKGYGGASCVKCAMKATEGYLYPLERNFLFLPKPTTLIPHADISNVEFSRVGSGMGNPRSFDVKFSLRSGVSYAFSNAPKEDHMFLEDFCRQKEIPFTRQEDPSLVSAGRRRAAEDGGDDLGLAKKRGALDFDEDDSDDEDYDAGSDSSVAEDYDSDVDEDDDAEEDEEDDEEDDDEDEE